MSWQDFVIGIGQLVFALSLFPSLLSDEKPARWTCALTALMLFIFCFTYLTLALPWSASSVFVCGVLWTILLAQRRRKPGIDAASLLNVCGYLEEGTSYKVTRLHDEVSVEKL
jgi:hypothetical protein